MFRFFFFFGHIPFEKFLTQLFSPNVCRLSDPSQYQSTVDAKWNIIYDKLDKCVESGAKVVLSRLAIGDLATQVSIVLLLNTFIHFSEVEKVRQHLGETLQVVDLYRSFLFL